MITLQTTVFVPGVQGRDILEFLDGCDDAAYQQWWPGTHLQFHAVRRTPGTVGSTFVMDEWVGSRRLRLKGVVTRYEPGRHFAAQLKKGVPLPAHLEIDTDDEADGVLLTHTLRAGFHGVGRALDPLLRLFVNAKFQRDMDAHAKAEFARLGELLQQRQAASA